MKRSLKIFTFLAVVLTTLSAFCSSVNPPVLFNGLIFESKNDGKTAWITKIMNKNGAPLGRQRVIIPSEIAGYPVTAINANVLVKTPISEVILPDSITQLALGQFLKCPYLERAVIGSGITEISFQCFSKCPSLKTVEISPNSHLQLIKADAFYGCSRLMHINLPASLTGIGNNAFKGTPIIPPAHLLLR